MQIIFQKINQGPKKQSDIEIENEKRKKENLPKKENTTIIGTPAKRAKKKMFPAFLSSISHIKYHYSPRPTKTEIEELIPENEKITRLSVKNIKFLIAKHKSSTNMCVTKKNEINKEHMNEINEKLFFKGFEVLQKEIKNEGYFLKNKCYLLSHLKTIKQEEQNNQNYIIDGDDELRTIIPSNDQMNYEHCKKCLKIIKQIN